MAALIGAVVVGALVGMFGVVALMALTRRPRMQAVDLAVVNARPTYVVGHSCGFGFSVRACSCV